jgi:hypothetical protein
VNGEGWGGTYQELSHDDMDMRSTELVVVRTGDHTLIGKFSFLTPRSFTDVFSIGQIAQLTGGETGNKSPLAVEMYGFTICLKFARDELELTKSIVKLQRPLCDVALYNRNHLRCRFPHCWHHYRL